MLITSFAISPKFVPEKSRSRLESAETGKKENEPVVKQGTALLLQGEDKEMKETDLPSFNKRGLAFHLNPGMVGQKFDGRYKLF